MGLACDEAGNEASARQDGASMGRVWASIRPILGEYGASIGQVWGQDGASMGLVWGVPNCMPYSCIQDPLPPPSLAPEPLTLYPPLTCNLPRDMRGPLLRRAWRLRGGARRPSGAKPKAREPGAQSPNTQMWGRRAGGVAFQRTRRLRRPSRRPWSEGTQRARPGDGWIDRSSPEEDQPI